VRTMRHASKPLALFVLLTAVGSEAQVAVAPAPVMGLGSAATNPPAPNTLVLGSGTAVSYDSNAQNSQPPTPNVQYTFSPQIGLNLARPKWNALISFVPGFSYSSANLSQYNAVSLTFAITVQYRLSQKLSLNFLNSLVSSTNPFDSLTTGYQPGQGGAPTSTGAALNYLPRTNEAASVDTAYNLSARTSLTALAAYNYISYQHDSNVPNAAQPFQQSNLAQVSLGLHRNSSPRYQSSVLYLGQLFDSGQGLIKTVGQSIQYSLQYSPKSNLHIWAMIGPEYVQTTYAGVLGTIGAANLVNPRTSGLGWTGSAGMTLTHSQSQWSASASKQLSIGTQYQGNVDQTFLQATYHRQLPRRTDLTLFGGYSINRPVSLARSVPRLSNNYLSTGAALSKTIDRCWVVGIGYWYLLQNSPQGLDNLYSGDHNRVAIFLSYSITKPLRR
jgi:hypothetical protein